MASVLVVDDCTQVRAFLCQVLAAEGHRVLAAKDAENALDILATERADLVVTDVMMPHLDGYEFVRRLRTHPVHARVPVIFHTAISHEQEATALAADCGAFGVLIKPCSPEVMVQRFREALAFGRRDVDLPPASFEQAHVRLLTDELSSKVSELEAVNRRLQAVLAIGLHVATEVDPEKILLAHCGGARELLGADFATAVLPDWPENAGMHVQSGLETQGARNAAAVGVTLCERGRRSAFRSLDLIEASHELCLEPRVDIPHSVLGVPIATSSGFFGVFVLSDKEHGDFSDDDERIATALAAQIATALENVRRLGVIQQHVTRLKHEAIERERLQTLLRAWAARLESVREEERTRIAREIHDELGQALTGIKMDLCWIRDRAASGRPSDSAALVERATSAAALIDDTLKTMRRIVAELRPGVLDDLGLLAAVEWLARDYEKRYSIRCDVRTDLETLDLDTDRSTALFRMLSEALTNVARHAAATKVCVRLRADAESIVLDVEDDGRGFEPEKIASGRFGLLGMRERMASVGGELHVTSSCRGSARVTATIPLETPASPERWPSTGVGRAAQ